MRIQRALTPMKGAPAPPPVPFGGVFTWWADMNTATYSNSGGTDYIDTVPLIGVVDQLEPPAASQRPIYNPSGLDGNVTMSTPFIAVNWKLYKATPSAIFAGGAGTLAFVQLFSGGITRALEFGSGYNYQIYSTGIYTPTNGAVFLNMGNSTNFHVHHFCWNGTTLNYYRDGVLQNSVLLTIGGNNANSFCVNNYRQLNAEQGYGETGDIVALTGTALNGTQVADDYNNFWKVKYPSLP